MKYSKELINEVRELYPNSKDLIQAAESGNAMLGRYLDDGSSGGFSVDRILLATSLETLQKEARLAKRKVELYVKWGKEVYPNNF